MDWVAKTKEYADANVKTITVLMSYFYKTTKEEEFKLVLDELESIKMFFNNIFITTQTAPYFLRFEKEISEQNVELLLNYNYESLIEDGTDTRTDGLIRKLIALIKQTWIKGDEKQRSRIKHYIILLLKYSIQFSESIKKC